MWVVSQDSTGLKICFWFSVWAFKVWDFGFGARACGFRFQGVVYWLLIT